MSVRLLIGSFLRVDGTVGDDFQVLVVGPITLIPQVADPTGLILLQGTFLPRQ
jgi:hypothetical protein